MTQQTPFFEPDDDITDRLHRLDADHHGVINAFGEAAREIARLRAINAEMLAALETVRETVLCEGDEAELGVVDAAITAATKG